MGLKLINTTAQRVQFRLRQAGGLFGALLVDGAGEACFDGAPAYALRVLVDDPGWRYELRRELQPGAADLLVARRAGEGQPPFELFEEPATGATALRCENVTAAPVRLLLLRRAPRLGLGCTLQPFEVRAFDLRDALDLRAVVEGYLSDSLALSDGTGTVEAFFDRRSGQPGLRRTR
jgi:hypothetical protein